MHVSLQTHTDVWSCIMSATLNKHVCSCVCDTLDRLQTKALLLLLWPYRLLRHNSWGVYFLAPFIEKPEQGITFKTSLSINDCRGWGTRTGRVRTQTNGGKCRPQTFIFDFQKVSDTKEMWYKKRETHQRIKNVCLWFKWRFLLKNWSNH